MLGVGYMGSTQPQSLALCMGSIYLPSQGSVLFCFKGTSSDAKGLHLALYIVSLLVTSRGPYGIQTRLSPVQGKHPSYCTSALSANQGFYRVGKN